MKKLTKVIVFALLFSGSTLVYLQSPSANTSIQDYSGKQTKNLNNNLIFRENGKNEIESPAPGKISLMAVYNNFERSGEYVLFNKNVIQLYTSPNGKPSGAIGPQVVTSSKRKGQWFLIDSYMGKRWIYNDDNVVELRDVVVKNAKLTLKETVYIHSKPFSAFRTNEEIVPTTLNVLKQAGSWYLVVYNSRQVWITTEKAKYEGTVSTLDTSNIYGVPLKKMIIPTGNKSIRPEYPLKPDYITVHNTANTEYGANAELHGRYLVNQASSNPEAWVSWHFTVDDQQIIQHLPLDESGFHAGDNGGPGNRSSIGIEIAENADGNYKKAEENAKKLISYLMYELKIPLEHVKGHIDWSGKYCPRVILNNGWPQFKASLQQIYKTVTPKTPLYRIITGDFVGEYRVRSALEALRSRTGWYATYEPSGNTTPYYKIVSGNFLGLKTVEQAMSDIRSETGWYMTIEKMQPAYYTYDIVTGGFKGLENVKEATNSLRRETGWYAYYEPTAKPNIYHIVIGGFAGEKRLNEAIDLIKKTRGWWVMSVPRKEPIYYYRIVTGGFLGENTVKEALLSQFTNRNWWATYLPTGSTAKNYRIVTGGFISLPVVEQSAQMIRETYGWMADVERFR